MFWTVVFAIFVVYYMTQTERYMCQYVCLIHFLGQTDKTSSMPMFVSRKYKCVWYPSNQSLKNSQCVGPQKCIPITNEVCPRWFGHNSRLVIGISWEFFTLGISRIEKLFISHVKIFRDNLWYFENCRDRKCGILHFLRFLDSIFIYISGYLLSIFSWFVRAHLSISQHLKSGLMMRTHVPF